MSKKKKSCGCFSFFACFTSKKTSSQSQPSQENPEIPQQNLENNENNESVISYSNSKSEKVIKKVEVLTKLTHEDVKMKDFINETAERLEFPYTCSICLRYFNKILQSSCCKNYICLFCIDDYNKRYITTPSLQIKCHYCNQENFAFIDINPTDKIKRYTDSLTSFYSNFNKTIKPLQIPNTISKLGDSPQIKNNFDENNPMNFYNTAEKPMENTLNKEKNVLFYSDGFKRNANNNPIINNHCNLYIYNESQADYQSLSKFYHNQQKNEEIHNDEEGLNNYYLDKNYNNFQNMRNIQKSDNKNISESAEFKNDESINDREEKIQDQNEDIPEQDEEIHEISQREIVQNQGFFKSFNSQIQKNKWQGNRIDFGETV